MTTSTSYVTGAELADWLGITDAADDVQLIDAAASGSRLVDSLCGRRFYEDSTSSARYYQPTDAYLVVIDDAVSVSAVAVDDGDDGTYSTTWAAGDYQAEPVNGVGQNGVSGWPKTKIRAVESRWFPTSHARPPVKVTAVWGWDNVPDDVKYATFLTASRMFRLRDSAYGIAAGGGEFGPIPVNDLREVHRLLDPYKRIEAGGGRFLVA